jgi:hypothetical protein
VVDLLDHTPQPGCRYLTLFSGSSKKTSNPPHITCSIQSDRKSNKPKYIHQEMAPSSRSSPTCNMYICLYKHRQVLSRLRYSELIQLDRHWHGKGVSIITTRARGRAKLPRAQVFCLYRPSPFIKESGGRPASLQIQLPSVVIVLLIIALTTSALVGCRGVWPARKPVFAAIV